VCSCSRALLKIEEAFTALDLGAQLLSGAVAIDLGTCFGWAGSERHPGSHQHDLWRCSLGSCGK
jgi:hypothetical protein